MSHDLRAMHHSIECPSLPVKSPLFRKVHTTRCSLSSCLPLTPEISRQEANTRPLIQKVSTSSGPSQATSSTTRTWFEKADAQMDKYQEEFMSKLWDGILKRLEEKLIDWILFSIGSFLLGVGCLCVFLVMSAFGIDIPKKDDKLPEGSDSEENREALKALGDILRRKDKLAEDYKNQADILLKSNDTLWKQYGTLLEKYITLSELADSQHKIILNLVDIIEQYKADKAKEQCKESPKKDAD